MLDKSRFAAFYTCFVDIIITICVQASSLQFVSGFTHPNIGLYSCVSQLKPTAFAMYFAWRELYIPFICVIHVVVIINSQTAVSKWVILIQISSEDHVY